MNLEQKRMHHSNLIGRLPKAFMGVAFVNFLVGASLGGWMANRPTLWPFLGSVHGEINPFGWLTMLIYGMTYAVLSISAGIHPPKAWVGWLHLLLSELAIIIVVTGTCLTKGTFLLQIGLACQFAAPLLFLANILSAVFSSHRQRNQAEVELLPRKNGQAPALSFLWRDLAYQMTDRVAQRGTNVSLILFAVGTGWIFLNSLGRSYPLSGDIIPRGALFLVYYGWIAGTILAVSLHLFPRFMGAAKIGANAATFGQMVWVLSMLIGTAGSIGSPLTARCGYRLLGVAFIWFSAIYLRSLLARGKSDGQGIQVPRTSRSVWFASWIFCLALGFALVLGLDPLSLAALHLLFLAFATNLVYGIGYTLFPLLLGRKTPAEPLAIVQVAAAIFGALLMVLAFLDMGSPHPYGTFTLLGIGGILATVGAIVFLLQWPLSKRA